MIVRSRYVIVLAILAVFMTAGYCQCDSWDVSAGFWQDSSINPNGVWTYGYKTTLTGDITPYTSIEVGDGRQPGWVMPGGTSVAGGVAKNVSNEAFQGWSWVEPGMVLMHPGSGGQFSIIRWTSPIDGYVKIDAVFSGQHPNWTTTDVHVLHNTNSLFSQQVNGFAGTAPNYTDRAGSSPVQAFSGRERVSTGDTIEFCVGYGSNNNYGCDGTGISATITQSSESATVSGTVTSTLPGNAPVAGATVQIIGGNSTTTDDNGQYTIVVPAGVASTIQADKKGYASAQITVNPASGDTVNGDIVLKAGVVSGTITSKSDSSPLFGAVQTDDGQYTTASIADSTYSLILPPGTYTIKASSGGYVASQPVSVTVNDGAETEQNFALDLESTFDAAVDFSVGSNPNGIWTYGYKTDTVATDLSNFPLGGYKNSCAPSIISWSGDGNMWAGGEISKNITSTAYQASWNAWWGPGELGFHPGPNGMKPTIRWTSPISSWVSISVVAKGTGNQDQKPTTDYNIVYDGSIVWTGNVDGFAGVPGTGEGACGGSPVVSYSGYLQVNAGDIIDFVGGDGGNDLSCDNTGMSVVIKPTSATSVITGTVTSALPGNAPIPGASVTVIGDGSPVLTDDSGQYSITIEPGTYTIRFSKLGYADKDISVAVEPNETKTVDAQLDAGVISGTIISSADGNPGVPYAHISVDGTQLKSYTDENGYYEITAPPGKYTLNISKTGYEDLSIADLTVTTGETTPEDGVMTFVKNAWDATFDFQTASNPWAYWTYGYVDFNGQYFELFNMCQSVSAGVNRWIYSGDESSGGYVGLNASGSIFNGLGGTVEPGSLFMHPNNSGNKPTIRWTSPMSGMMLIHAKFSGRTTAPTTTDGNIFVNGTSIFSGFVNGFAGTAAKQYKDASGVSPVVETWQFQNINAGDTVDFSVGYGENKNYGWDLTAVAADIQESTPPGTITGQVTSSNFGTPIAGARVESEGGIYAITDPDGRYTMQVPSGDVKLKASADGYDSLEKMVSVDEDETVTCDFALICGVATGHVVEAGTGTPLNGASVTSEGKTIYTSETGEYTLILLPGTHAITVKYPGYISQTITLDMPGTVTQEFALVKEAKIDADLAADFDSGINPNSYWTYGWYANSTIGQFSVYTDQSKPITGELEGWGNIGSLVNGYMLKNFSDTDMTWNGSVPAQSIIMHPSNTDNMPTARWTAPEAAKVFVSGKFSSAGAATTDGNVVLNGTKVLCQGYINQSSNPVWNFATIVDVAKGDTIDISLGYGSNKTYNSDLTGVTAHITSDFTLNKTDVNGLKNCQDGTLVSLSSPCIVTVPSGAFTDGSVYIEEPERFTAVKVVGATGLLEGDKITLTGSVKTDDAGQKYIQLISIDSKVNDKQLGALGMTNKSLQGAMTSNLLVKTWGKITGVAADGSYAYVDDGSEMSDGTGTGVKVILNGLASPLSVLPKAGDNVAVTGIALRVKAGESLITVILPRGAADVMNTSTTSAAGL